MATRNPPSTMAVQANNSSSNANSSSSSSAVAKTVVQSIIIPNQGPFGATIASMGGGASAMITNVVSGSQADRAGLKVGDVPVASSSPCGGMNNAMKEAFSYKQFLAICKAPTRPVVFEVVRNAAPTDNTGMAVGSKNVKVPFASSVPKASARAKKISLSPQPPRSLQGVSNASVISAPSTMKENISPPNSSSSASDESCLTAVRKESTADVSVPIKAKDPSPPLASKPSVKDGVTAAVVATTNENANPKENSVADSIPSETKVGKVQPLPPQTELISMTKKQLLETALACNIKVKKSGGKDDLREALGLPVRQWNKWKAMKIKELKEELKKRNIKPLSGKKWELLERLGVPRHFDETSHEKRSRELDEVLRANEKRRKTEAKKDAVASAFLATALLASAMARSRKKNDDDDLDSIDDPKKEAYEEKCCGNAEFDANNREPAGMVRFRDGSVSECWRCVNCGKIPSRPNAPVGVEEFDESDDYEDAFHHGRDMGRRANGDCIIQ